MALNVAFYGVGDRARPYLDALARRRDANVAAVCDLSRRAAEQAAAYWGSQVFLSFEAMLQEARPNALWICVAPHLQGDVILKAAEHRIPFFVEPPGAVDYARACLYNQAIAEAGLVTTVGFAARSLDVVQESRGYLGAHPVPLALGWWLSPGTMPTPENPHGAGEAAKSAPETADELLWNEACPMVDLLRFFCGEVVHVDAVRPRAISAHVNGRSSGVASGESRDLASAACTDSAKGMVIQLQFASGTVGVLTCAAYARPQPRVELELMGDGWTLSFGDAMSALHLAERDKTTIIRSLNSAQADHAAAFLEAVRTGNPSAVGSSYADALRTLAICHAGSLSAKEGRRVLVKELDGQRGPSLAPTPGSARPGSPPCF